MSLWRQRLMLQLPISTIWCVMAANTISFCPSSTTAVLDGMRSHCKRDDPGLSFSRKPHSLAEAGTSSREGLSTRIIVNGVGPEI